jgi:hypothetical protein
MENSSLSVHPNTEEGLNQRRSIRQAEDAGMSDVRQFKAREANLPRAPLSGQIPALPAAAGTPAVLRNIAGELERVLDELRGIEYRRQSALAELVRRQNARSTLILLAVAVLAIAAVIAAKVVAG